MITDKLLNEILPVNAIELAASYNELIKLLKSYGFDEEKAREIADRGIAHLSTK